MFVWGLSLARGGSKGARRKNLRPLCGKPLLEHTFETALETKPLWRTVGSMLRCSVGSGASASIDRDDWKRAGLLHMDRLVAARG
jgi:hypothetical protein